MTATDNTKKAVVLLSGGLDSATVMAIAKSKGYLLYALSFDYGQRHKIEVECSEQICRDFNIIEHKIITIDLATFGHSALTDNNIDVPENQPLFKDTNDIPVTYVPARNTIFLSYALAFAEVIHAFDIFIGVNAVDYSGYPDCRPKYIEAFERMANLAVATTIQNHQKITIHTPLIHLQKSEIIAKGLELGVNYKHTNSCYNPTLEGKACGVCDSCQIRLEGFKSNKVADPTIYA